MQSHPARTVGKITVKKLLMMETGTYNTQYRRPWETEINGHTLNALGNALQGATKFTPSLLAGIANQMIAPSATPEHAVGIVGGWGERRLRFMMEVENRMMAGGVSTIVLLGWTNGMGVNISSHAIAPDMEFYINSVVQVRTTVEHTPMGNQTYTNVAQNAHILVDPGYIDAYTQNKTHAMRPEDVYATMSLNHLSGLGDVLDTRTVLSQVPVASRRGNGIAADYAATLLDNYKKAEMDNNFGVVAETDTLETARGYSQEQPISYNPFFQALSKFRDGMVSNFFTWRDLLQMDPNTDNVAIVNFLGQTNHAAPTLAGVHQANMGISQDWSGSDRLTQVATILSQSVPGLMMDLTITAISFITTNRRILPNAIGQHLPFDQQGKVSTAIVNAEGFSSVDLAPYLQHFAMKLEHFVLNDISFNNQIDFHIEMQADLLGETWIKISLEGGPLVPYVTPSFADALMVPVITGNEHLSHQLSKDFSQVFHHLNDHMSPQTPSFNGQQAQFGLA